MLCTATNESPHERFFGFNRRTGLGTSLPSWLTEPGPVMLRNYNANSKNDPMVHEVELIHANPTYGYVKHPDGRESTVSLKDLAPCPRQNNSQLEVLRDSSISQPTPSLPSPSDRQEEDQGESAMNQASTTPAADKDTDVE